MERRPHQLTNEFQFVKTSAQAEQVYKLAETVVGQLTAGVHQINDISTFYIKSGISDALYRIGPKVPSGLISVKAHQQLDEGCITKKGLTKEHPISRNKTALDIISFYDYNQSKLRKTDIVIGVAKIYERGCQVHYVTKEENQYLKVFQQDHSLTPEECYKQAGVELIPFIEKPKMVLYYLGREYESQVEIRNTLNISKYQIRKLIASGDIVLLDKPIEERC